MKYSFLILSLIALFSCSDPKADLIKEIDTLSTVMKAEDFPSEENMNKIVGLYNLYLLTYPEDELALNYMELKAKYLSANNDYAGAIKAYDDIIAKFPEGNRKADALFMQAFIYEDNMLDLGSAEAKYQSFIEQYPKHELVHDAQFAIENLSLSDEELFEKLMMMQNESLEIDSFIE
jgi:TolA-binding protein